MSIGTLFWPIITAIDVWKGMGWNAIIYLAAISSNDPTLYEAAVTDGISRFKQMRFITLPTSMYLRKVAIKWLKFFLLVVLEKFQYRYEAHNVIIILALFSNRTYHNNIT